MTARMGHLRVRQRSGPVALLPKRELNEPDGQRDDPIEVAFESLVGPGWDGLVAREVSHQARIEAAFDRMDACARLGDLECALDWLGRAEELGGGLSPAYRVQRARWAHQLARQQRLAREAGEDRADAVSGEKRSRC